MGKNILVTGGAGRLANYVSPYLKEKGYNVANFDVVPPQPGHPNFDLKMPFIKGDLCDLGDCMRAITTAQPDTIVHLGAIPHNTEQQQPFKDWDPYTQDGARFFQMKNEDETMKTNVMGTYYLMDAARRLGVKNVVMATSYFSTGIGFRLSGTSFPVSYLPIDEEHPVYPEDTYSLSKHIDEDILQSFSRAYGMNTVAMRLLGVYYMDSERHRQMYKFNIQVPAATTEKGGYLISNTYQYVDARDIAVFVGLCLEKELKGYEAFFVSSDTVYNEKTADVIKKRWPVLGDMGKDIPGSEGIISIKKAEKMLGYKSIYTWRNNL